MVRTCYQINLQQQLGGGEIYTRFLTRALQDLGFQVTLLIHPSAHFWDGLGMEGVRLVQTRNPDEIVTLLPEKRSLIITHAPVHADVAYNLSKRHSLAGMVHLPLYKRSADAHKAYPTVFAVSGYVLQGLYNAGIHQAYAEPLYGVADLTPRGNTSGMIEAQSMFEWDKDKGRDLLLSYIHPWYQRFKQRKAFQRREGIALGIVSRITTIKQFDLLFKHLTPILCEFPQFHIEIFGSGGYASIRDLKRGLRPIRERVRYWGQQEDVAHVYPLLDYVMTGLPEKEALGLNVIEAQYSGTPVLAVKAPPFTETVVEAKTGYFYTDPRKDGGADFRRLLVMLQQQKHRLDPRKAETHLAKFSFNQFCERIRKAVDYALQL